jgi:hypothetical protein
MFPIFWSALLLLIVFPTELVVNAGLVYSYMVTGTVYCNNAAINIRNQPMDNLNVRFRESDPLFDDELDEVTTKSGFFAVSGDENEGDEPEPYLQIRHSCKGDETNARVYLKTVPAHQKLSIYLGDDAHAVMHLPNGGGKEDVPNEVALKMEI